MRLNPFGIQYGRQTVQRLGIQTPRGVSVKYQSANGSASAGGDYTPTNGTLTIPAGSTTGMIFIPVIGESIYEIDEDLVVELTNPVNVTILDSEGTGTIANDDTGRFYSDRQCHGSGGQ